MATDFIIFFRVVSLLPLISGFLCTDTMGQYSFFYGLVIDIQYHEDKIQALTFSNYRMYNHYSKLQSLVYYS